MDLKAVLKHIETHEANYVVNKPVVTKYWINGDTHFICTIQTTEGIGILANNHYWFNDTYLGIGLTGHTKMLTRLGFKCRMADHMVFAQLHHVVDEVETLVFEQVTKVLDGVTTYNFWPEKDKFGSIELDLLNGRVVTNITDHNGDSLSFADVEKTPRAWIAKLCEETNKIVR